LKRLGDVRVDQLTQPGAERSSISAEVIVHDA
jgi:hypothetical protein